MAVKKWTGMAALLASKFVGPWKAAWGRKAAPDGDIRITCDRCDVTFVHTLAAQATFKQRATISRLWACPPTLHTNAALSDFHPTE